jgi:membrane associated rhomboid family serine protease
MRGQQMGISIPFNGAVKNLIIINLAVWLVLQIIVGKFVINDVGLINFHLGLVPALVIDKGFVWQVFTYQFLHSFSPMHIIFNMLILWMFGAELQARWGSKFFLKYYLFCGVGAGLIYVTVYGIYSLITGSVAHLVTPVVGASGAVFGVMLAYGLIFSERTIYFMMLFPLKAKHFVMILAAVEFLWILTGSQAGVANVAHLGGFVCGFAFLSWESRKKGMSKRKKSRSKGGPELKLVVDNEKSDDDGPRYWN